MALQMRTIGGTLGEFFGDVGAAVGDVAGGIGATVGKIKNLSSKLKKPKRHKVKEAKTNVSKDTDEY